MNETMIWLRKKLKRDWNEAGGWKYIKLITFTLIGLILFLLWTLTSFKVLGLI